MISAHPAPTFLDSRPALRGNGMADLYSEAVGYFIPNAKDPLQTAETHLCAIIFIEGLIF
jgi:hypothetical protein